MQLCVRDARMPRADFLRLFPGNETDQTWSDDLAKRNTSGLKPLVKKRRIVAASRN
jgi:RNA polymerase primary sigma factor